MQNRFPLSSQDCEILLAFEARKSLQSLAESMAKDISVVSRNLKAISERAPVIEKQSGKWMLTPQGIALNRWTREAIYSQSLALNQQRSVKIACTREFAARILLPKIRDLVGEGDVAASVVSNDKGIEQMLLSGEAEFGFDCGRPMDPLVAYKQVIDEPFVVVAAPKFLTRHKIKNFEQLQKQDLLKFTRTENVILDLEVEASRYYGTFNDVGSIRQACVLGYGWAILPMYTIRKEIKDKALKIVPGLDLKPERYGVWWLRDRGSVEPWVNKAKKWLANQNLG